MLTSEALKKIAVGDRAAFSALFATAQPSLVRYAGALLAGDIDAALDVVDEAFLSIWREAGRYAGEGNADGWVRRIVRNKAVDWLRARRERPLASSHDEDRAASLIDDADSPERSAEISSSARELRGALERLSPDHREVVWLCYFEEKSLSEIAAIMGRPENTVKTRLFHARKQLRNQLQRFVPD